MFVASLPNTPIPSLPAPIFMLQHRGGPCVPTAHAVKEMQMGIAIAGGHQAGHQGMRLPMQAKPNFPEISGGGEKLLDLSDLSDRQSRVKRNTSSYLR
jgi:hypothetical protein